MNEQYSTASCVLGHAADNCFMNDTHVYLTFIRDAHVEAAYLIRNHTVRITTIRGPGAMQARLRALLLFAMDIYIQSPRQVVQNHWEML